MAAQKVDIPDLFRDWPWPRKLNQYYDEVRAESNKWIHTFAFFDGKSQDAFDRCDFSKLAMLTYSGHDQARARTGCDLMTLFYVFDEYTDVEDEHVTQQMATIFMDGMRNTTKLQPHPLGKMTQQFWILGKKTSTPMAERHLYETMQQYVDAVVQQSEDREHDRIRSIPEYWAVRRHTSGCLPSFALIELELDFPEEVYRHPLLEHLRDCAMFSIVIANDIYSYNVERAKGHALHNLATIVMHAKNLGPQEAVKWIGEWNDGIVKSFLHCKDNLPSWGGDIDSQVRKYVDGLAQWVRGNDDWSFESQRFFGTQGLKIQKTKKVWMLPRVEAVASRSLSLREEVETEKHHIAGMQIRRDLAREETVSY